MQWLLSEKNKSRCVNLVSINQVGRHDDVFNNQDGCLLEVLMYVGVVELLKNLPLFGGGFVSPLIRDLENRRDVLTGQSTGWALVNATSRRSLRLLCGEYGQIECKNLYAIWRRNHGEQSMYRRDDEKGNINLVSLPRSTCLT